MAMRGMVPAPPSAGVGNISSDGLFAFGGVAKVQNPLRQIIQDNILAYRAAVKAQKGQQSHYDPGDYRKGPSDSATRS